MSRPDAPASVRKQCESPTYFCGKLGFVEDLVAMHAAERDLGGGDEAQIGVGDRVDLPRLRIRVAGHEADPLQHLDAGQVGRDDRRVAARDQLLHRVLDQRHLQQCGFVLEEVELLAGHRGAGFEIDEIERFGQSNVILRARSRTSAARRTRRIILLSAGVRPTGASGCVMFGMVMRRRVSRPRLF